MSEPLSLEVFQAVSKAELASAGRERMRKDAAEKVELARKLSEEAATLSEQARQFDEDYEAAADVLEQERGLDREAFDKMISARLAALSIAMGGDFTVQASDPKKDAEARKDASKRKAKPRKEDAPQAEPTPVAAVPVVETPIVETPVLTESPHVVPVDAPSEEAQAVEAASMASVVSAVEPLPENRAVIPAVVVAGITTQVDEKPEAPVASVAVAELPVVDAQPGSIEVVWEDTSVVEAAQGAPAVTNVEPVVESPAPVQEVIVPVKADSATEIPASVQPSTSVSTEAPPRIKPRRPVAIAPTVTASDASLASPAHAPLHRAPEEPAIPDFLA